MPNHNRQFEKHNRLMPRSNINITSCPCLIATSMNSHICILIETCIHLILCLFIIITGFVTHFFFLCGTVIWILYLFHLFLVVSFPIWSKFLSEQKWKIRLHVVEVIGSLVLCSIAPTVCISLSEYTIFRYPPLFVRPSGDAAFYSVVLPNAILTAIGVDITIYSLYSIRKVN